MFWINITTHQLIKNILGPQEIHSINECNDGLLLCSIKNENGNCAIVKYKYENEGHTITVRFDHNEGSWKHGWMIDEMNEDIEWT